jgi:hypothetical protein
MQTPVEQVVMDVEGALDMKTYRVNVPGGGIPTVREHDELAVKFVDTPELPDTGETEQPETV